MDTNKMRDISREQFEAWAIGHFVNLFGEDIVEKDFGGDYVQHNVRMAWVGWKNSREAVVVTLPRISGHEYDPLADADYREGCREAIEAQGLKVAP